MMTVRVRRWVRWSVATVGGVVVGFVVARWFDPAAAVLSAWAALAIIASSWALLDVWNMDAAETRAHATAEDPGRRVTRAISIIGSVASLATVAAVAARAQHVSGFEAYALAVIAVLSVVSSWLLIQTDYMLRYARVYYEDDAGGINFNQEEDPAYSDFAYFTVGLGMTYQVADTNVTRGAVRRIVIAQTMLAYLFGAGIIATVINLIASLG